MRPPNEDLPWFFPAILWAFFLIGFILMISGCATTAAPPTTVVAHAPALEPQKIPVLIPCLTADQVPKPPASWMKANQSREKMEIAAAADLLELDQYIVKSQGRMLDCVKSFEEKK